MKNFIRFVFWLCIVASAYAGFTIIDGESLFYWRILLVWSGLAWDDIQNTYLFDSITTAQIPVRTAIGGGNIDTRCFAWGNQMMEMFGNVEIPHDLYNSTGAILSPHIHWMWQTTDATTTGIRYMDYTVLHNWMVYSSTSTSSIPIFWFTWRQQRISDFPDISATWYSLWDMISFRIYRTPTGSDTYAGSMCLQQLWFHYQKDVFGSRQEYIK